MKQRSLLILSVAVMLFASCGRKGGKTGLMVPKDAAIVVHINSPSISSKISWNEIKQSNWFREMRSNAGPNDSLAQKLFDDPDNSGVDTKKDFIMFVRKHGRGSYLIMEGSLTSEAAYQQLLADMNKNEPKEIKKTGDFSYMEPHEKTVVLWNKSKFAVATNAGIPGNVGGMAGFMKGRGMPDDFSFGADSLRIFAEQALTLEGGDNLDSDARFADLVKNGSDVHIWFNLEQYNNGINTALPMIKTDELAKGNITAISVNFDNGKITAKSKHYYGDEMSRIMSNNKPQPVSADVLNRIPSSNVVAVLAINYSPASLKETIRLMGMDAMADMYLSKVNFSVDEFVKANKGEVLLAVTDPGMGGKPDTASMKGGMKMFPFPKPDVNILFATSVNDKAAFEKMVTIIWDLTKQFKAAMSGRSDGDMEKGKGSDQPAIPGINYKLENNWFAVSNSEQVRDKFLAGGNSNLSFVSQISGHPIGLYVDLQKIGQVMGSMHNTDTAAHSRANIFQDIVAKGGDFKDKSSDFEIEVNFIDKNTNSLKQLNQFMDKMSTMRKERMEHRQADMGLSTDSVVVAMPKIKKHK